MSALEEKIIEFKLNMRYRKGYTETLVGQCREFPFIIVEGNTFDELRNELIYELEAYFNTFPEEGKKAMKRYDKEMVNASREAVEIKEEVKVIIEKEGWGQKEILAPIAIRS